jgi:hypothetical protein
MPWLQLPVILLGKMRLGVHLRIDFQAVTLFKITYQINSPGRRSADTGCAYLYGRWHYNGQSYCGESKKDTTTGISEGRVNYIDTDGNEKTFTADSVVATEGGRPRQDTALEYCGSANRFFIIGDCRTVGDVKNCMHSAFNVASMLEQFLPFLPFLLKGWFGGCPLSSNTSI